MKLVHAIAGSIIAAFALAPAALAQDKDKSATKQEARKEGRDAKKEAKKGGQDQRAVRDMAEANLAEVEAGKLAADKAQNDEVKKFASQMVDDHGKQLDEVKKLAQSKNVQVPSEPAKKHQSAMKKLQSASGAQFDRSYMDQMVKDHRDTLKQLQGISKKSRDSEVKAAAEKAMPKVKEHLQMAEQIAGKMKDGGRKRGDKK